jgi:hypothetical protein
MTSKVRYDGGTEDSAPNITRVNKSRRTRWAQHMARMGEKRGEYGVLVGKYILKSHVEYLDGDGRNRRNGPGLDQSGSG